MGFTACIGQFLLVALNILFLAVSVGLIVLGIIVLRFFSKVFKDDFLESTLDDIKADVQVLHGQNIEEDLDGLYEVYGYFGILMIVVGTIMFLMSVFGLVGSCCQVKKLLIIYIFTLCGFIVAQVTIAGLFIWQADLLRKNISGPLKDLVKEYQGSNGTNAESWAWNFVMRKYDCCGVEDYTDFQRGNKWWEKPDHLTPYMCCKVFPKTVAEGQSCAGASNTASVSTIEETNNYNQGCLDAVWESVIDKNNGYLISCLFLLLVLEVTVVIFSCIIYHDDKGDQSRRVHPNEVRHPKVNRTTKRTAVAVAPPPPDYW